MASTLRGRSPIDTTLHIVIFRIDDETTSYRPTKSVKHWTLQALSYIYLNSYHHSLCFSRSATWFWGWGNLVSSCLLASAPERVGIWFSHSTSDMEPTHRDGLLLWLFFLFFSSFAVHEQHWLMGKHCHLVFSPSCLHMVQTHKEGLLSADLF